MCLLVIPSRSSPVGNFFLSHLPMLFFWIVSSYWFAGVLLAGAISPFGFIVFNAIFVVKSNFLFCAFYCPV